MKDNLHLQYDWLPVLGEMVEIRHGEQVVRTGIVDAVTPDGGILWLAAQATAPRSMFERSQGFSIWIEYKWESAASKHP